MVVVCSFRNVKPFSFTYFWHSCCGRPLLADRRAVRFACYGLCWAARRTPRRSAKSSGRRGRSPAPRASTSSRRRRVAQSPAPSEGTITDDSEPDTDGSELLTPASAAGTSTTTTTTTTTTVTRSRSSRRSTATSPAPPSRAARGTVIYKHTNQGQLTHRLQHLAQPSNSLMKMRVGCLEGQQGLQPL